MIKEAVNQVLQAHLIACHDLVTQVLLEHDLMARSHIHRYVHTHRAALQLGSLQYWHYLHFGGA